MNTTTAAGDEAHPDPATVTISDAALPVRRRAQKRGHSYLLAATAVSGIVMVAAGLWALAAPRSFAAIANFPPYNEHFAHDLGAFQLGIGVTLLLALIWRDALALGLAGFLVGNSVHAVNHAADRDLGGHGHGDWISLTVLSLAVAAALVLRLRELGYVVGEVRGALVADLEPFVEQNRSRRRSASQSTATAPSSAPSSGPARSSVSATTPSSRSLPRRRAAGRRAQPSAPGRGNWPATSGGMPDTCWAASTRCSKASSSHRLTTSSGASGDGRCTTSFFHSGRKEASANHDERSSDSGAAAPST